MTRGLNSEDFLTVMGCKQAYKRSLLFASFPLVAWFPRRLRECPPEDGRRSIGAAGRGSASTEYGESKGAAVGPHLFILLGVPRSAG